MKTSKLKRPSMTPSSIIKAKTEDEIEMTPEKKETRMASNAANPTSRVDTGYGKVIVASEAEGGIIDSIEKKAHAAGDAIKSALGAPGVTQEDPKKQRLLRTSSMAEGGMARSIANEIMKRRKMANGGEVDLDLNSMEQPNAYYSRDEEILKENYAEDMHDMSQPMDSNEMGDEREDNTSDPHDMIDAIRRKMNSKARR